MIVMPIRNIKDIYVNSSCLKSPFREGARVCWLGCVWGVRILPLREGGRWGVVRFSEALPNRKSRMAALAKADLAI